MEVLLDGFEVTAKKEKGLSRITFWSTMWDWLTEVRIGGLSVSYEIYNIQKLVIPKKLVNNKYYLKELLVGRYSLNVTSATKR